MTATVLGLVLERRGDADISAIGGDHSCHLLPLLDRELIRTNPKVVIGYSDMTVLNLAIHARTGLVTFNGPHAMAVFGQFPQPHCYTVESFQRVLTQTEAPGTIAPATDWTEELQEWATQEDLKRPVPCSHREDGPGTKGSGRGTMSQTQTL